MNKPILLCITQDDSLGTEIKHTFAGSPFAVRFCQTPAGALAQLAEDPVSVLIIDFHPIAGDAQAFLQVLAEADPSLIPLALCRPEDLLAALQAKADGAISDILGLPLSKNQALAQVCRVTAQSILVRLAGLIPEATDKIIAAEDRQTVISLLSELLVDSKRSVFSSLSADLHLGVTGWQTTIFADSSQALILDSQVSLLTRLAAQALHRIDASPDTARHAEYDDLSGVYNKLGLMAALQREVERTERYGSLLALMILDLDGFAELNKNFGRQTGDRILKGLGNVLDGLTRRTDIIARLGNDEFCLLLPGLNLEQAVKAVGRVRREVGSWARAAMHEVPVSLSFGVASYRHGGNRPEQLLNDALAALTHARAQGAATIGLFDGELQIAKE